MERSKLAIALILIVIAGMLVAILFDVNLPGIARYSHSLGQYPPEEDATLWEKAAWENSHGNVPQCGFFADSQGPVVLYPSSVITISNISFRFSLAPGEPVHEISNITYTLSNRYAMKTVRAGDPGVMVTYQPKNLLPGMLPGDLHNTILDGDEIVTVELDMEKMGPGTPVLGPNQKFVVDIVPAGYCSRDFIFLGTTPLAFLPGIPVEMSGRL